MIVYSVCEDVEVGVPEITQDEDRLRPAGREGVTEQEVIVEPVFVGLRFTSVFTLKR